MNPTIDRVQPFPCLSPHAEGKIGLPEWLRAPEPGVLAGGVDLRAWFPPVIDQGFRPLCAAAVTTSIAGFYATRAGERSFTPSVLFNYRMGRAIAGRPNGCGTTLEASFRAWFEAGMVAEQDWPLEDELVDQDPPETVRRDAPARACSRYWRIDGTELLPVARTSLGNAAPVAITIPLHPLLLEAFHDDVVRLPEDGETVFGEHAVALVGYDDAQRSPGQDRPGALLVRNSWGPRWADGGYAWLPYRDFLRRNLRTMWIAEPPDRAAK